MIYKQGRQLCAADLRQKLYYSYAQSVRQFCKRFGETETAGASMVSYGEMHLLTEQVD